MSCPLCNSARNQKVLKNQVFSCKKCGAVYGTCYLGESYEYVRPYMAPAATDPNMDRSLYFDFTCLGSQGISRRHGWFDPNSRLVTQAG